MVEGKWILLAGVGAYFKLEDNKTISTQPKIAMTWIKTNRVRK